MTYEEEIKSEENLIREFQRQARATRLPARTINWQNQNAGVYPRGIIRNVLIARKQRRQINTKIATSRARIVSLREALLGVE